MRLLLLIVAITGSMAVSAQVGIGVNHANVDPSAQLEVSSTNKGFLVPRMTSSQRTGISNPASGLLVYQTDAPIGFYYFTQGNWKQLGEQDITMKLSISDTTSMLSGYARVQRMLDSLFLVQTRLNQKLNSSDTVLMLSYYTRASRLLDSLASVQLKLNLKLNISDTAAMLSNRFNRDTANLSLRIDSVKTVLTNYLPLTGGALTGSLNGTSATLSGNLKTGAVTYPNSDGINGFVLTTDGNGIASWASNGGVTNVGPISATATPTGAYIASNTLYLAPADADNAGIVSIVSQTFAGEKTFNSDLNVNGITVGRGAGSNNGSNTAIGLNALVNNTTGFQNTASGESSLYSNTTGRRNTANGHNAMYSNTTGNENTASGESSLYSNTTGLWNTANGHNAMLNNTTGSYNTAIGHSADVFSDGLNNTTAIGYGAIVALSNTIQLGNTDVTNVKTSGTITAGAVTYPNRDSISGLILTTDGAGTASWVSNNGVTTVGPISATATPTGAYIASNTLYLAPADADNAGIISTATQTFAGVKTFSSDLNVNGITVGRGAGSDNGSNTAIGLNALVNNTTGFQNTAIGESSLYNNTTGSTNTANGNNTMYNNTTGNENTASGESSLSSNTIGSNNTAIGRDALKENKSGSNNTAIGYQADVADTSLQNATAIGSGAKVNRSNQIMLGNASIDTVFTSGKLKLGTITYPNTAGTNGYVLTTDGSGTASWASNNGITTVGPISATATPTGAYIASNTLYLAPADADNAGIVSTATQTFAGKKTFNSDLTVNGKITSSNTDRSTFAGKLTVGTNSDTTSSAVLEASSTTQGFLPPRLTTTQRDAITTPVAGLTIWNTTNTQLEVYDGSYWKNMVGLLVSPLNVGDTYGGGKVFYIFGPSDNGFIKGQTHGLIAATEDQTTDAGVKWFPDKFYGATGTYIGLGLPNTLAIITSALVTGTTNMSSFAAGLANSYRGGGYIDWFLPSKDELNLLYQARNSIGGFATSGIPGYWSSTQKGGISFTNFTSFANGVTSARLQFFYTGGTPVQTTGTITDTGIENLRRVRAIRIF